MLRRKMPAGLVTLITAVYFVSSIGCSTGALSRRSATPVPLPSAAAAATTDSAALDTQRLPSTAEQPVALAQYNSPSGGPISTAVDYDAVDVNVDEVVRGQGYPNGPLKEFFINPYVIGAAIIAAIAIPLATDPRDTPVGGGT